MIATELPCCGDNIGQNCVIITQFNLCNRYIIIATEITHSARDQLFRVCSSAFTLCTDYWSRAEKLPLVVHRTQRAPYENSSWPGSLQMVHATELRKKYKIGWFKLEIWKFDTDIVK